MGGGHNNLKQSNMMFSKDGTLQQSIINFNLKSNQDKYEKFTRFDLHLDQV